MQLQLRIADAWNDFGQTRAFIHTNIKIRSILDPRILARPCNGKSKWIGMRAKIGLLIEAMAAVQASPEGADAMRKKHEGLFTGEAMRRCIGAFLLGAGLALAILAVGPVRAQDGGYDPRSWVFDGEQNVMLAPGDVAPPGNQADNQGVRRDWEPIPKRIVSYSGSEPAGTVIVDTSAKRLDLILGGRKALRYAVGVGREGFGWSGRDRVSAKRQWPDWRPPADMLARERARGRLLPAFVRGGHNNPLGARALYIGSTLYRIHGTNEPWTVGTATSSGCIRLTNEDAIDLYERVPIGANVVVRN
jgi:lipoprotein-anchoring transpeptidase ErfK/SrfK